LNIKKKISAITAAVLVMFGTALVLEAPQAAASVTTAIMYTDAYYRGWSTGLGGGVDCDYSGYRYSWSHQSTLGATSSIGVYYNSPHCNTAKMFTTYGGQVICYLPCSYVGNAANDQIIAVDIYRRSGT
jgi:hypothetical protein